MVEHIRRPDGTPDRLRGLGDHRRRLARALARLRELQRRRRLRGLRGPIAAVELIADRGEAAVEDEFFRSRQFLDAEGVTHTLLVADESGRAAVPLLVRDVPGRGGAPGRDLPVLPIRALR